jgi:hypothetical protein
VLAIVSSYDPAIDSVVFQQLANLVGIPRGEKHFITFPSELIDDGTEERHVRGIVQVDPNLPMDRWGNYFRSFGDSYAGVEHHLFLIASNGLSLPYLAQTP